MYQKSNSYKCFLNIMTTFSMNQNFDIEWGKEMGLFFWQDFLPKTAKNAYAIKGGPYTNLIKEKILYSNGQIWSP